MLLQYSSNEFKIIIIFSFSLTKQSSISKYYLIYLNCKTFEHLEVGSLIWPSLHDQNLIVQVVNAKLTLF
jgi:hypothetical protein